MKIRFINAFSTARESFEAGKDYEVENGDALRYINSGAARKSVEPTEPERPVAAESSILKPDEHIGDKADKTKPAAKAVSSPRPNPSNNPAAFLHGDGTIEPHTGFTTTEPDAKTSPPSDGKSPLASHVAPEAIGNATVGSPAGSPAKK